MTTRYLNQGAITDLLAALKAIPEHEKAEYIHALTVAPHLVEKESNPIAFLTCCDWDATAAARRLTLYWRRRTEVFGQARAFRPVLDDTSGNGALGMDEIEILRSGAVCLMPNDCHGREVACADLSRIPPRLRKNHQARLRAAFFVFQQVSLNTLSQTWGCVGVINGLITTTRDGADGDTTAKRAPKLIFEAFPVKVCALHVAWIRSAGFGFLQSLVPYVLENMAHLFSDKLRVHNCESKEQFVAVMAKHGVPRESLPPSLGGLAESDGTLTGSLSKQVPLTLFGPNVVEDTTTSPEVDFDSAQDSPVLDEFVLDSSTSSKDQVSSVAKQSLEDSGDIFPEMLFEADFDEADDSPFEPIPVGVPATRQRARTDDDDSGNLIGPRKKQDTRQQTTFQHQNNSSMQDDDDDDGLFSKMMDVTDFRTQEGSPFEPKPIQSQPQQQQQQQQQQLLGVDMSQHQQSAPEPFMSAFVNEEAAARLLGGDNDNFVETPDMLKRGLAAINEAMRGLSFDERSAYLEALQKAPLVVKTESDPLQYLRFEKFNGWAASKRLALYWKHRVQYFGARAFFPMSQTMGGALWVEDLRTLAAGSFFLLPADSHGRPVLGYRPSKLSDECSIESRIRVALYFLSILSCEHPAVVTQGCVVLVFVSSSIADVTKFDEDARRVADIALDACPVSSCEIHVIYSPLAYPSISTLHSLAGILPSVQHAFGRLTLTKSRAHLHVGDTPEELQRKLVSCGISGACLQAAMNGGISNHDFAEWMEGRQTLESQRFSRFPPPVFVDQTQQHPSLPTTMDAVGAVTFDDDADMVAVIKEALPDMVVDSSVIQQDIVGSAAPPVVEEALSEQVGGNNPAPQQDVILSSSMPLVSTAMDGAELMHGVVPVIPSPPPESVGGSSASLQDMIGAAMQMVPVTEKQAYLEAMEKAPNLVQKESDPSGFLKAGNYNTLAAAKRLASYWQTRRKIFGARAHLPMNQTTDGALSRKDITVLQSGFLSQLPNDSAGRSVIFCDGSRLDRTLSPSSHVRLFFYLWSIVSENELSRTNNGYTVLYSLTEPTLDRALSKCLDAAMQAHPLMLKRFHLLDCRPGDTIGSEDPHGQTVREITEMLNRYGVQETTLVHVCESRAGFADKLVSHGLRKEALPKLFGGMWGLEDFAKWQELRTRYEWDLPIPASMRKVAERYSVPTSHSLPPLSSLSDAEKAERQRRLNVIHAKRKRDRDRFELESLQEQVSALGEEKKKLMGEGRQLEELLQQARSATNEE